MSQNVKLVQSYFNALEKGDFETVSSLISDDLIWHQPGQSPLSGTFNGKQAVFAHLGDFAQLSGGTFAIDGVEYITSNGDLVVSCIHFKASSENHSIEMKGIDLFRIMDNKIQEVWLFSEDIQAEDHFWTILSKK